MLMAQDNDDEISILETIYRCENKKVIYIYITFLLFLVPELKILFLNCSSLK